MTPQGVELFRQLETVTDLDKRTRIVHAWMKLLPDDVKRQYAINWRIPHTLFNITCKHVPADFIQDIDWFEIYQSHDLGVWSHGGDAYTI